MITSEDVKKLSYASAAVALKQTLDTLNVEGITIGAYEMMCMFNRQSFTAEKQSALRAECLNQGMFIFFHSREQIVVMRQPKDQRFPRMLTTEFETAVRDAHRQQATTSASLDSAGPSAVS